jgi:protoheme IX farnesyltransferase
LTGGTGTLRSRITTSRLDGRHSHIGSAAGDFFALLKPRVMSLVVFTAFVGLVATGAESITPVIAITAARRGTALWTPSGLQSAVLDARYRLFAGGRSPRGACSPGGLVFGLCCRVTVATLRRAGQLACSALLALIFFYYSHVWLKRGAAEHRDRRRRGRSSDDRLGAATGT